MHAQCYIADYKFNWHNSVAVQKTIGCIVEESHAILEQTGLSVTLGRTLLPPAFCEQLGLSTYNYVIATAQHMYSTWSHVHCLSHLWHACDWDGHEQLVSQLDHVFPKTVLVWVCPNQLLMCIIRFPNTDNQHPTRSVVHIFSCVYYEYTIHMQCQQLVN